MLIARIARQSSRLLTSANAPHFPLAAACIKSTSISRQLSTTRIRRREEDDHPVQKYTGGDTTHEGSFSRTDKIINIEHPDEEDYPQSHPVQGRGGLHFKRTLASFTLEDKVGIVTGGARGLGLVMSQALVISGADVAIVDLNSEHINHSVGPCSM